MLRKYQKKNKRLALLLAFVMIISNICSYNVQAAKRIDRIAPTAPTNLKVVTVTYQSVSLSWTASTDNTGIKCYAIYKNSTLIGTTTATSYQAVGLSPLTTYNFYVAARDYAGNQSANSNTISVNTLAQPVSTTSTPTPTATTAPTSTPILTVTPTPTVIATPTPTATPVVSATPTPVQTVTPTVTPVPLSSKKTVGYYAAWAAYSGITPDKLDATKLTHINYAFANIGSDLKIALGYPDVDPSNISKLNALKQVNPQLKTIIAVGGWSWSSRFSDVALTDASRTAFADSCVDFIIKYGFDGIDIDWEYPVSGGLSTNVRRPEDKHNFTLLLQKLREKLNTRGTLDGKHYILSFAGADGSWYLNNTEPALLSSIVDYANLMTYDIHGSWDTYTDFHAPLYNNSDSSPQDKWSADASVNAWVNAGFPASKIVMGIPFYGYVYKAVTNLNYGLYQTYSGCSSISYANIATNYLNASGYVRHFHTQSMVPWLFNGSTFISYEDEQSIGYKTQYIKNKGLGGAMIWELSQDPNKVLLNAVYNGLK